MLSGDGNENGQNKISKSTSEKKKQLCWVQHNFFLYISLSLFCTTTTWNFQKLPSNAFYGANVVCVSGPFVFFSLPLMTIFTSVAASISHFLTASIKISYFPTPNEIGLLCFLSLSLAFSL